MLNAVLLNAGTVGILGVTVFCGLSCLAGHLVFLVPTYWQVVALNHCDNQK